MSQTAKNFHWPYLDMIALWLLSRVCTFVQGSVGASLAKSISRNM
jgi:hypothetical protein